MYGGPPKLASHLICSHCFVYNIHELQVVEPSAVYILKVDYQLVLSTRELCACAPTGGGERYLFALLQISLDWVQLHRLNAISMLRYAMGKSSGPEHFDVWSTQTTTQARTSL